MAIMIQKFENGKFLNFDIFFALELSCCKKWQKSPNQETGLGNGNV
jgi:hypothetical protein